VTHWAKPLPIENKAGANGIPGAEVGQNASSDPYTLLVTTSTTQAANVSLYKKLPYDPVKDFTPIGKIGETGFILMVKPEFPAKDMKEFVAHAKTNKLAYGHGVLRVHWSLAHWSRNWVGLTP
jgi:tripartite-type tricarboxylate transporter receptor subunit TctC